MCSLKMHETNTFVCILSVVFKNKTGSVEYAQVLRACLQVWLLHWGMACQWGYLLYFHYLHFSQK